MDLRPGMMVGDHARLVRPLGEGGMGMVWVAHHLRLDTEVAVKVIGDRDLRKDPELVERLRREARAAARIRSPHVVHIYDQGVLDDGSPYLLMELLVGESLAERIEREHVIALDVAAEIVRQTVSALTAAHDLSIVHRDIKPDNLFLTGEPERPFVKVLDFGIALRHGVDNPDLRLTTTDRIVGTPAYMSPEQLLSAGDPGPHVDYWALAITAYEMLTGALPHEGETLAQLMMAVTSGDHVPPRRSRPALPKEVDIWFARALALDVEDRFSPGKEFAETFEKVCRDAREAMAHIADELATTDAADEDVTASMKHPLGGTTSMDAEGESPPALDPLGSTAPVTTIVDERLPSEAHAFPAAHPAAPPHPLVAEAPEPPHGPTPVVPAPVATVERKRGAGPLIGGMLLGLLAIGAGGVAIWKLSGERAPRHPGPKPSAVAATSSARPEDKPAVPQGMVLIPAGSYTIGCDKGTPRCFADEGPAHRVELDAFAIDEREVTREAYAECVAQKRCAPLLTTEECGGEAGDPVRCVDWRAAMAYCDFRGARLPTEQEWEAAARGPRALRHPWGDDPLSCDTAVIRDPRGQGCGSGGPRSDGHAEDASPFGVRNMAGNVREWTSSPYAAYPNGKARKLEGHYVNRGGSFALTAKEAGAAHTRIADKPDTRRPDLGLRCAAYLTR